MVDNRKPKGRQWRGAKTPTKTPLRAKEFAPHRLGTPTDE